MVDTLKTKSEQVLSNGDDKNRQSLEYESVKKTMEYEKEKFANILDLMNLSTVLILNLSMYQLQAKL